MPRHNRIHPKQIKQSCGTFFARGTFWHIFSFFSLKNIVSYCYWFRSAYCLRKMIFLFKTLNWQEGIEDISREDALEIGKVGLRQCVHPVVDCRVIQRPKRGKLSRFILIEAVKWMTNTSYMHMYCIKLVQRPMGADYFTRNMIIVVAFYILLAPCSQNTWRVNLARQRLIL